MDRVLSVSTRIAERMAREFRFPLEQITTIHNGVDLDRFRPRDRSAARARLDLPTGATVVGTVGRMLPVKDHDTLLSALARIRSSGTHVITVMAGNGPLEGHLRRRAADLRLDVRFLGSRPDIEDVLPACDIYVSSSVSEGLSNTILEAMATGIPVVATRVGGTDELVQDGLTGVLVPAADPAALAEAIESVVTQPAMRRDMGLSSRARAERLFGLDRMVQNYERVYLELAARLPGLRLA
jgi:glycosyltransferase involved in cell wall biosynthesis